MGTLLIIYETKYGQTRKIAEHIAGVARSRGHAVEVTAVADVAPRELSNADAYLVLAPVFLGKHPPATKRFVVEHGATLNKRPSAFLSVSGSAGSSRDEDLLEAHKRAVDFVAPTPWRPNMIRTAGGAIAYPQYDFLTRFIMKRISKEQGRSTDTSRSHELTDWRAVDRVARELLAFIEPRSERRAADVAPASPRA